jgi:hypothetical protein
VPPLHVLLLSAATIRDTLLQVLHDEGCSKSSSMKNGSETRLSGASNKSLLE